MSVPFTGGEIIVYTFRHGADDGEDFGTWCTMDRDEAIAYARKHNLLVVENVYEWQEALPADDFRENG